MSVKGPITNIAGRTVIPGARVFGGTAGRRPQEVPVRRSLRTRILAGVVYTAVLGAGVHLGVTVYAHARTGFPGLVESGDATVTGIVLLSVVAVTVIFAISAAFDH
jgi:hypothetical protein